MTRPNVASCLGLAVVALAVGTGCIRRTAAPGVTSAAGAAARTPVAVTVRVLPAERHQTLAGFGASLAWHLEKVVGRNTPADIYDVLFPQLGLDILRLRNRYQRHKPDDQNLGQEVEIVRRATQALGRRPIILLSSWAPPAPLKADGQEDCHGNRDCTLARENGRFVYEKFADYWHDSLQHYATLGIVPDYVSIENEPSFIPPRWEGCKFEPRETADYPGYGEALAAVAAKIRTLPAPPQLLGPEVLGIHWGLLQKYLEAMNSDLVVGVAHHLYERGPDKIWDWRMPGPDSFVDEMQAAAAATRKPLWQTEFQTDEDRGVEGGFETAWLIHHSLVEEGVVAFLYWDLVWDGSGGLVSMNGSGYKRRDQYFALAHYARFTDPGYVRVGATTTAPGVRASAYVSPASDQLALVVLNTDPATPAEVRVDAGGFSYARAAAYRTIFRPGASETWADQGSAGPGSGSVLALPPRSMATVVLSAR